MILDCENTMDARSCSLCELIQLHTSTVNAAQRVRNERGAPFLGEHTKKHQGSIRFGNSASGHVARLLVTFFRVM